MSKLLGIVVAIIGIKLAGAVLGQEAVSASATFEEAPLPPLDLTLAAPAAVAEGGTFWLYSASSGDVALPPFPFDPYGGVMPVYVLPNLSGQYLIGDTKQDYAELQALLRSLRRLESSVSTMTLLSGDIPEFPGDDEEGGGEGGTNDVDLMLVPDSLTNGMATLAIHNPEDSTNEPTAWLVWSITNLAFCDDLWALDADNWAWVAATASGQTNVTVPLLSDLSGFYRLADPLNDADGDGLRDWYSWLHFGHQRGWASDSSRAADDYDSDGINNGDECANSTNPNDIRFRSRFPDFFVNQTSVSGYCEVEAGVPLELAVLINNTNLASAQWQPYAGNFATSLGTTDGVYIVRVALRGRDPGFPPVWDDTEIILDRVAPVMAITNPVSLPATVLKPYLQLIGNADEPLIQLTYSLSNAFGLRTNLSAHVVDQDFDTNAFDFTTNWFQAYDVPLATNLNAITLQVTDRAGNVSSTNLQVTLNYDGSTNPVTQLLWPTNGVTMAGDTMTLRGQIDDETAGVSVRWVDDGQTNTWPGIVERNGRFWVEGLPLSPGTNELTLVAQNAAGHVSETGFTVNRGVLNLVVTSTTDGEQLYDSFGYTGGTVDPGCSVTVNGVEATVDESGNWSATDVPLYGRGLAVFDVSATPGGGGSSLRMGAMSSLTSGGGTEYLTLTKEMPAAIRVVKHYVKQAYTHPSNEHTWTKIYRAWDEAQPNGSVRHRYQGTASKYWSALQYSGATLINYTWSDTNVVGSFQRTSSLEVGSSGSMTGGDWLVKTVPDQQLDHTGVWDHYVTHFHARGVRHEWLEHSAVETLEARTQLRSYAHGPGAIGRKSLQWISVKASEYGKPGSPEGSYPPESALDAGGIAVNGTPLGADGRYWKVVANGSVMDLNLQLGRPRMHR